MLAVGPGLAPPINPASSVSIKFGARRSSARDLTQGVQDLVIHSARPMMPTLLLLAAPVI
jgi:hypothetical protein